MQGSSPFGQSSSAFSFGASSAPSFSFGGASAASPFGGPASSAAFSSSGFGAFGQSQAAPAFGQQVRQCGLALHTLAVACDMTGILHKAALGT